MQNQYTETLKTLHLYEIRTEAALQSRVVMKPDKISDYEKAYSNQTELPPLLVAMQKNSKGEPSYRLLDGWHRYKALENTKGLSASVKVKALEVPVNISIHALRFLGGRENLKNGLPLTHKDKKELFISYVKGKANKDGNRYKSYREIARDLSTVTHQTLHNWMRIEFPSIAILMSKELGDEFGGQPSAQGTGQRVVDMPDLSSRERDLALDALLEEAKACSAQERQLIIEGVEGLLMTLKAFPSESMSESDSLTPTINIDDEDRF